MLDKNFVLKIFEGFSIQRWNDLVRPFDIVEMDKAAEKMVAAYIIGKFEEKAGRTIDWTRMIYSSLFDLLRKIALCDIKSPVQQMIRNRYPNEFKKINQWIFNQYKDLISDKKLLEMFSVYCQEDASAGVHSQSLTDRVLQAAHRFSSIRELQMIEPVNESERTERIKEELLSEAGKFFDLEGMRQLMDRKSRAFQFVMKIEQLRFQTRWNQTPRVPQTSVLGHCFFVAVLSLLLLRESGESVCNKRLFNVYFSGLFHDLPESVTRDIISPVKQATSDLPSIVKKIEDEIVNSELVPLMEDFFVDEILYFTSDEFQNRILISELDGNKSTQIISYEELRDNYNSDIYSPVDGKIVRLADHLSALIEAESSIKYGITSRQLTSGRDNILKLYLTGTKINGIDAMQLFWSIMEQ